MRIGLFLGSFDPIHIGHQLNIVKALDKDRPNHVNKVIIVPAFQNPWKKEKSVPFENRFEMCRAIAHQMYRENGKENVLVSDIEARMKVGTRYSYLVLEELQKQFPSDKLSIICGTDISNEIKDWKNGDWVLSNFELLTLDRGGQVDSKEPTITISSSNIRDMIDKGKNPLPFISTLTYAYIKKNQLYNCRFKYF